MCLLQAFWMTAVALEHAQRVSRQLQSLIRRRLPLWRIQHMLYIESVNSLVCHAWRLRSTVLMTSYKILHISPGKRVAWSSKQPKVLHSTSYFLAIMPPKKRQKQTLMSAFTKYPYVVIIDSWSLVTRFSICRFSFGRIASHLTDVWSLFLARDRQIGLCWPQTYRLYNGHLIAHQNFAWWEKKNLTSLENCPPKVCEVGFFPTKFFYQIYPWMVLHMCHVG